MDINNSMRTGKNTFIEQCLTCDQCKKSFKNYITFKEHIKNEQKKNELADDKNPFLVTKNVKQESKKQFKEYLFMCDF